MADLLFIRSQMAGILPAASNSAEAASAAVSDPPRSPSRTAAYVAHLLEYQEKRLFSDPFAEDFLDPAPRCGEGGGRRWRAGPGHRPRNPPARASR